MNSAEVSAWRHFPEGPSATMGELDTGATRMRRSAALDKSRIELSKAFALLASADQERLLELTALLGSATPENQQEAETRLRQLSALAQEGTLDIRDGIDGIVSYLKRHQAG